MSVAIHELVDGRKCVEMLVRDGVVDWKDTSPLSKKVAKGEVRWHSKPGSNKKFYLYREVVDDIRNSHSASHDPQREANKRRRSGGSLLDEENLPESSLADMTDEERAEYNRQLFAEQERLRDAQEKAKSAGVDIGLEKTPNSLNKVKIFRELYMGKIAQLDFKKKSGELVEKSEVEKDGYEAGRLIRDNLLNFSHKMSMKVAALSDPKEIEAILESEIHQILEQISNVEN